MASPIMRMGREGIVKLKDAYLAGQKRGDTPEVCDYVQTALGLSPGHVTVDRARGWDATARLELALLGVSVPDPVRANNYERDPQADRDKRAQSRVAPIRTVVTLLNRRLAMAQSDAQQADATADDIEIHVRLRIAADQLDYVTDRLTVP